MEDLAESLVTRFLADTLYVRSTFNQAVMQQANKILGMSIEDGVQRRLDDLHQRDKRLIDMAEDGAIGIVEFRQRRDRIAEERKKLLSSLERADSRGDDSAEKEAAARIVQKMLSWPSAGSVKQKKAFMLQTFSEIYFREAAITAFRLAPGALSPACPAWGHLIDIPIALDPPLRLKIAPPEIKEGQKRCTKCGVIKHSGDFYKGFSCCKSCHNAACRARYHLGKKLDH